MRNALREGKWKSLLMGLGFSVSSLLAGGLLGILYVKLFVPAKEMGWDGIADMLGGLMVGGAIGLFAGIYLAWKLPLRKQAMGTGASNWQRLIVMLHPPSRSSRGGRKLSLLILSPKRLRTQAARCGQNRRG